MITPSRRVTRRSTSSADSGTDSADKAAPVQARTVHPPCRNYLYPPLLARTERGTKFRLRIQELRCCGVQRWGQKPPPLPTIPKSGSE